MNTNRKHSIIKVMVLLACLELTGCVPEGGVTPRVIEGDWSLIKMDGQASSWGDITWEFGEDGDFQFCYDGDCTYGDWEWNRDKTELNIDYTDYYGNTYSYFTEFEVDVLDHEVLKGTWEVSGSSYELEFERD